MPPPPNQTPATAIALGPLPVSLTIDVTTPPATDELWYRYTAVPGDLVVGVSALAAPSATYPLLSVYSDAGITLYRDLATHNRVQVPVTRGATYYLQISDVPGASTTIALTADRGPNVATTAWSLAIPDDTPGFPMVIHSPVDGSVQQMRPFPAGETAHVLPNGLSLWHDAGTGTIRRYDGSLAYQSTPAWTFSGAPPMSSNRVDTFYVGDRGTGGAPARITTVSTAGTRTTEPVWYLPFTGMTALAISNDETIAYLTGQVSSLDSQIRRWSLVSSSYLTPLAAAASGYIVMNPMLVLDDDTLIAGYYRNSPLDSFARRYALDGTILHTYALGAVKLDHVTHNTSDTSFWVWLHLSGAEDGLSRFQQIQVSDGTILAEWDVAQYEGGVYQGTVQPPPTPFGHSFSCPGTLVPPLPPYDDGGPGGGSTEPPFVAPSYHLDARYIRRLRRAPHVAQENARVFYRRFELDLERGQGLADGQGSDPMVLLRISRDGGQTWGEESRMAAGKLGEYTARVIARRLGHGRDLVFEVVVSDPIAWSLVGAWLDLEPGTN